MTPAVTIVRSERASALLYDSPHSGREYPPDFHSRASRLELRRGEDAYVDDLLVRSPAIGATLLTATYPRCYIDVNRADTDLDASMLSEPWPGVLAPTEKSARGLGLIRRYVVPGVEAQAAPLSVDAVRRRIGLAYEPYHAALAALVDEIRAERGVVWHVNWHSMKSVGNAMTPDGAGARRPDFVVSDLLGRSTAPEVTTLVVETLRALGYVVAVNDPYTGGTIVQRIGRPAAGVHSVQVEINRRLYLDEAAVEKGPGFTALQADLAELTRVLAAAADTFRPASP